MTWHTCLKTKLFCCITGIDTSYVFKSAWNHYVVGVSKFLGILSLATSALKSFVFVDVTSRSKFRDTSFPFNYFTLSWMHFFHLSAYNLEATLRISNNWIENWDFEYESPKALFKFFGQIQLIYAKIFQFLFSWRVISLQPMKSGYETGYMYPKV